MTPRRWLKNWFRRHPTQNRTGKPGAKRLFVHQLEDRVVPTTRLFLDFGIGVGMGNTISISVDNFRQIFGAIGTGTNMTDSVTAGTDVMDFSPLSYDFNGDTLINNADITALANAVVPRVQRALEPFDIDVVVANNATFAAAKTNVEDNAGDASGEFDAYVYVMNITSTTTTLGPGSMGAPQGLFGRAAALDLNAQAGNDNDEAALTFIDQVFGSTSGTPGTAAFNANFAQRVAFTATHEGFHTFTYVHTPDESPPTATANERLLASGDVIRRGSNTRENPFIVTRFDLAHDGFAVAEPNNYLLAATDPDIGLRDADNSGKSDLAYVTGTGAHDRITLANAGGGKVDVTIQAYSDAPKTNLIATETYQIDLATDTDGTILVDASINSDEVVIDGDINATFRVRGGIGTDGTPAETDRVIIHANNKQGVYTPSGSDGGSVAFTGGATFVLSEIERLDIQDALTLVVNGSAGPDAFEVLDDGASFVAVTGTLNGVPMVTLTLDDDRPVSIDAAGGDDSFDVHDLTMSATLNLNGGTGANNTATVDDTNISGATGDGLAAGNLKTFTVTNSTFNNNSGDGISGAGVGTVSFTDVTASGNDPGVNINGFVSFSDVGGTYNGNLFEGIRLQNGGKVELDGTTTNTNGTDGIELDNVGAVTFTDVTSDFNGGDGANVDDADDVTMKQTGFGVEFYLNTGNGVVLSNVGIVDVFSGEASDNGLSGLVITNALDVSIDFWDTNNNVAGDGTRLTNVDKVSIDQTFANGNGGYGLDISGADDVTIIDSGLGSKFSTNGVDGLRLATVGNVSIVSTTAQSNTGIGLRIAGALAVEVDASDFDGIDVSSAASFKTTGGAVSSSDKTSVNVTGDITINSQLNGVTSTKLVAGGDINIVSGQVSTPGGTVLLDSGTSPKAIKPTKSLTDVTASKLSFGSDLAVSITGTTVDTGFTQLNVVGDVDLANLDLVLSGSYVFQSGDRLPIVKATGTITGTFANYPIPATLMFNGKLLEIYYNYAAKQVELTLAPTLGALGLTFWTVGVPYNAAIPIYDGTAPYTAVPASTGLPPGLTAAVVGSTVVISGTPTTAGSFTPTINITDTAMVVASKTYAMKITTAMASGYAFDPIAETFWYQVVGHATADTTIGLASETILAGSGIRVTGTDNAPVPDNGGFSLALQDSDIDALQFVLGKTFTGVRINLGNGNDTVNASLLGPATSAPYHQVNVVDAGGGNDTLIGGGRNDTLNGGDGNDSVQGNLGRDEMNGGAGNDSVIADYADFVAPGPVLTGDGGTDILWMDGKPPAAVPTVPGKAVYVNVDFESIIGGNGDDAVDSTGSGAVFFAGNGGNDSFLGGAGNDTLLGGAENDTLLGGAGRDSILGEDGNDSLVGGTGNDTLVGGNGNDSIQGGLDADSLLGENGADWLDYSDDTLGLFVALGTYPALSTMALGPAGGSADGDVIDNTFENIIGGEGNDFLMGNNRIDTDDTTPGDQGQTGLAGVQQGNVILGGGGGDQVYGQEGQDSISGGTGSDTVYGNAGDDVLDGEADNDTLYGGDGNDTIVGGAGQDDLQGDNHDDVLYGDEATLSRTVVVLTNQGANTFPNKMSGSNGPLRATAFVHGTDTVQGGNGTDMIDVGGGANNIADGGLGNDTFILYGTGIAEYAPAQAFSQATFAMNDLGNQYWGGAGPDTFMVVHAWDIYQLTDGPAGFTVQVNNASRTQAMINYLNSLQGAAPTQTDYDGPEDILVFDQLIV